MFLVMFLLIGAFFIVSNDNLHFGRSEELYSFGEKYYSWFLDLGGNVKNLVGHVVKLEWMPQSVE